METCNTNGCDRKATGIAYSMSVELGAFCNNHGRRLLDSGEADSSETLNQD